MKRLYCMLSVGLCGLFAIRPVFAQDGLAERAEVKWSETVDGLRARIVLKRSHVTAGTPIIATYLVLQNVSGVLNPMKVVWGSRQMTYRLLDADGNELPRYNAPYSGQAFIGPMDLILPLRGELSFDISCRGMGIGSDRTFLLDLGPSNSWSTLRREDCFLHAILEIEPVAQRRNGSTRVWSGRLELPPVKVPLASEPIDNAVIEDRINDRGRKMIENGRDSEAAERALSLIDDPRVIPWYLKAMDTNSRHLKIKALDRFARFEGEEAFSGIKRGMDTQAADIGNTRTPELAADSAGDVRNVAAHALRRSTHPDARRLLLAMWNDPDYAVRLTVLHELGQMDTTESIDLIRQMTKDTNATVAKEAQRYLALRMKPQDD
jgi:hypothetical protein